MMIILLPFFTSGQEVLTGVGGNPVVESHANKLDMYGQYKSGFETYVPLNLPFYDDFSNITIYPDTGLWIDNEAYINATFPLYPINYGVATMDVIDARGYVYFEATPFTFLADHLTSKPIRLDSVVDPGSGQMKALTPADSPPSHREGGMHRCHMIPWPLNLVTTMAIRYFPISTPPPFSVTITLRPWRSTEGNGYPLAL